MVVGFFPTACACLLAVSPVADGGCDTTGSVRLEGVVVRGATSGSGRSLALPVEVAGRGFLREFFTGDLSRTLGRVAGVRSMDIGSGFAKPVIRGMGFNRVVVSENGIKQEGQQWGADHGLEIDAFGVERVTVVKGPVSLLYGSDAMGGAVEISRGLPPAKEGIYGEVAMMAKSVNGTLGGSVMVGAKRGSWFTRFRYSERHFGDYRVPTDTIVYLTRRLPIHGRALKNTAGAERDAEGHVEYLSGGYHGWLAASNAYQKVGFFPGAHGIPDASRLTDDGNRWNVEMPYSVVNHLKLSTRQQLARWGALFSWDAGYQGNRREEWSLFHTHYGGQQPPERFPDRELSFFLETLSSSASARWGTEGREWTVGWDAQGQWNRVGGYAFLLPDYDRWTTGLFALFTFRVGERFSASGGARYDRGRVSVAASEDVYLADYLRGRGYDEAEIEYYRWRAYGARRHFGDVSASFGAEWRVDERQSLRINAGRGFRLPGAHELASNGVHHGAFRHEQGDPSLSSERGWQLDLSYTREGAGFSFSFSPFCSFFRNYIYLIPTGEWSVLPHAGQIYRYAGARVVFAGAELSLGMDLPGGFRYHFTGEYVYTRNRDARVPLSFSPPASARNVLSWGGARFRCHAEWQCTATQRQVARNEDPTPGANLFHAGATGTLSLGGARAEVTLSLQNLLGTRYHNHLSFYRKVEIPEPGCDIQMVIRVSF
ncbi:MAG: TonB-dependent receptor [Odoribacteraceae bacterium]|jgi:iron complex outermembrane receptor protein|nr:TonB-dependent receptor [Odoribacteraceae bacterium]